MAHGYEHIPVEEIRAKLTELGVDEDFIKQNTKLTLVQKLIELTATADLDNAEEIADTALEPMSEDSATQFLPAFGSELWTNYMLGQLRDNELSGDAPKCDGCRRLVNTFIGPTNTFVKAYTPPNVENDRTATVVVSVECHIVNDTHPAYGTTIIVEDIADVNKYNTDEPYSKYQSATAKTRAEGRALRQILQLTDVITAEEVSQAVETVIDDRGWEPTEPITRSQVDTIDVVCKRLDIDAWAFMNSGQKQYENLLQIQKTTAAMMLNRLDAISHKTKQRPPTIGSYKINWLSQYDLSMLI